MKIKTKIFGEVDIAEEKILQFDNGIIGLENLKRFALLYDSGKEEGNAVTWLQSLDEEDFAMPVISPYLVMEKYNPVVDDMLLLPLGEFEVDDLMLFTTLKVPADIKQMTANLKAPVIINSKTRKGCQLVVENEEYLVKHPVYEALKALRERTGE